MSDKIKLSTGTNSGQFDDEFLDREVSKMNQLPKDQGDFLAQAMLAANSLKTAIESVGGTFTIHEALADLTQSAYEPTQTMNERLVDLQAKRIAELEHDLEAARMKANELGAEVSRLRNELADQNHYAHKLELRLATEHNAMIETGLKLEEMAGRIVELENSNTLTLAKAYLKATSE